MVLIDESKNKTISPDTIILVSALESNETVSVYLGGDQKNHIDIALKVKNIKEGVALRSEIGSLSDGLDASAHWKNALYFLSSKYPTFVTFKIISIDMENQISVVQVSGKLVDPNNEKYLEFKETSFEITGDFFKEFTKSLKNEITEITPRQIRDLEQEYGKYLFMQKKAIVIAFDKCRPDGYKKFAQYKINKWLPVVTKTNDLFRADFEKYGFVRLKPEFEKIRSIYSAMSDLNSVSIQMQSFLKNQNTESLEFINGKLAEISRLADQYADLQASEIN
jgi:hypothetical protein